jgi:branched-chain amino acid aminotransferase
MCDGLVNSPAKGGGINKLELRINMKIDFKKAEKLKEKPDANNLGFGKIFCDYMFTMLYDEGCGWHDAKIEPFANFEMNPAAMVFHYAQECFEGLKAFRGQTGEIGIFRPDENAKRMNKTHKRLCMPPIDEADFACAVKALVKTEKEWVPSAEGTSLYLRPCTIATQANLGVKVSESYLFYIIASPSGAYYTEGINPIKIYVEDEYIRAAPGGTGGVKFGGNYAASLIAQKKAEKLGYSQVLWLDGVERKYVDEVGSMNCFFVIDGKIYTAPTENGTVLEGITRKSCIELLKEKGLQVFEEKVSINSIVNAAKNGSLQEIFGTGTAAAISPVGQLGYKNEDIIINGGKIGEITAELYKELTDIQYGRIADKHGWVVKV